MKPHKGILWDAYPIYIGNDYVYGGRFDGHPKFHGRRGHTSMIVYEYPHHRDQPFEVETLNSRYTIILNENNSNIDTRYPRTSQI